MYRAIIVFCLIGFTFAQVPSIGHCPNVSTVQNFDVSKYLGRWYEAERYFAVFELAAKCVTADYSAGENGTVTVVNSQISSITGNPSSVEGSARVPDPNEPAKLKVSFSSVPFGIEGNYWILGTDYESYAVVYSCTDLNLINFKYAWILTRERNPADSVIERAVKVIEANNIDRSKFRKTTQTDCDKEPPQRK